MWQVEGTAGSLFVVATHQGAAREDAPARAWTELDRADVFVAEADEVREGDAYHHPAGWDAAYYLPKGTHLDDLISQGDVEELARDLDTNYASVSRMKPWVAFVLLASSALRLAQPSLNEAYLGRAIKRGLTPMFLETWESQVAYLDAAITPAKLERAIADYPHRIRCELHYRLAAFRAGDDRVFINDQVEGEPVLVRIESWTAKLDDVMRGGHHAFVAVGIGQLVGPHGILANLAARGYTVRRVGG